LLAEYAPERARETRPATLATLTIELGRRAPQEREQRVRQAHGRVEVDLHVLLDALPADLREPAAPGGAGVVDEQVEPAVLGLHRVGDPPRCGLLRQVGRHDGRAAELVGERAQPILAAGDEHELRAVARETARGCLADPARGACDQSDHAADPTLGS
jgi:hypothetical protein